MDELIKMRDLMRKAANNIDEILALDESEKNGEDVKEASETALGKFTYTMMQLQSLSESMGN